jgi:hypothetical protein
MLLRSPAVSDYSTPPSILDFNSTTDSHSSSSPSSTDDENFQIVQLSSPSNVPASLSQTVEHLATAFYFRNIVEPSCHPSSIQTFVRYTIPLYNETPVDSTLHKSIEAVALGVFSLYPERNYLQPQARRLYTQALKDIRNDIDDPVRVKLDQTLGSVLMLASFEVSDRSRRIYKVEANFNNRIS